MQVFNLFLKIMRNNIPSAMIYIIVFFAIAVPMSNMGAEQTSFEETSLKICVFDEDQTAASQKLIDFIGQKNEIVTLEKDNQTIMDAMYYETVAYAFTINKGYEEKLKDIDATEGFFQTFAMHESYPVAMMDQLLDEYVRTVQGYVAGGSDLTKAIEKAEESVATDAEVTYESFNDSGNTTGDFTVKESFLFRYLPYIFISILVNLLCPILIAFNRRDQRFRINCSCIRQSRLTAQLFLGCAAVVSVIWLIFTIGAVVLHGMYTGIAWIAVLNSLIFALISAAIALLVASFSPSENVVSMITQIVGLGMGFLCGVFVPQSMLGDGVLAAARFLPAYWYEKVNDSLSGQTTFDLHQIWAGIGIEVGFLVLLSLVVLFVNLKKASAGRVKNAAASAE